MRIAEHADLAGCCDDVGAAIANAKSALEFEAAGQMLCDCCGSKDEFERVVSAVFKDIESKKDDGMIRRIQLLQGIPFEAILTTNIDGLLEGVRPSEEVYSRILRRTLMWWELAEWPEPPRIPIVHLHGTVGVPDNPVVLARADYRRLLYKDSRYSSFLRSVFATRTVLFLGVSFTDAYLNELRSEILALLREPSLKTPPLAYAVLNDQTESQRRYLKQHEGIEVLNYSTRPDADGKPTTWQGFDEWLRAIYDRTSADARLKELLHGRRVVWLDPARDNNSYGVTVLEKAGAKVNLIAVPDELDEENHSDADLLITHFGYKDGIAAKVLGRVGSWGDERPPVIVFATPEHAAENRSRVLRLGAFEYAWDWGELFRLIEQLFGRDLGI